MNQSSDKQAGVSLAVAEADRYQAAMLMARSIMHEGYTRADFAGVSAQDIEAGYTRAYQLIDAGQADKAELILESLCLLDHFQSKLFFALGVSRQLQGKHEKAIVAYGSAVMLDANNPHIFMRTAECYMAQGLWEEAKMAADCTIDLCGAQVAFVAVRKRAETIRQSSQRKMGANR